MVGLALEGGGAKGAYQVGAYLALINSGIKFDFIAGTSIGAFNAAMMAKGNPEALVNLWLSLTSDIIGLDSDLVKKFKTKKIKLADIKNGFSSLKKILKNKGIDTAPLMQIFNDNIDEKKLRKKKTKMGLITVKLKKMEPVELMIDDIPEGKLTEYILASCYLPVFAFKKIIDEEYYLDGAFHNNLPLQLLEKQGCKTIYTVSLGSIGFKNNKISKDTKVIQIKPKKSLGSLLVLDPEISLLNMRRGYLDALKAISKADGKKYYFKYKNDRYYSRIIRKMDSKLIAKLKKQYKAKTDKELVIKIVEQLLKKEKVDDLFLYNLKKQIRYLKKNAVIKKKDEQEFIISCNLFW